MASKLKKATPWIVTIVMVGIAAFAVAALMTKNAEGDGNGKDKGEQKEGGKEGESGGGGESKPKRIITLDQDKLSSYSYAEISADMLERVIKGEDVNKHMELMRNADPEKLDQQLNTEELRLCFWINTYNANAQYQLKKDPSLYKSDRNEFFKKEQIYVAGYQVSMNDIEHGVMRRGATIWSKGHVRIPFRNEFVNKYKMDNVDYRIHFALNCGAKSCPPVCVYLPSRTNAQLSTGTCYYLKKEAEYDKEKDLLKLPALMTWFSDDFGTRDDKRDIVAQCKVIPDDASPSIEYKDYDWTMKVENYKQF